VQEIQQERLRLQTDTLPEGDSVQASAVKQQIAGAQILIVAQEVTTSPLLSCTSVATVLSKLTAF